MLSKFWTGPQVSAVAANYNYAYACSDVVPQNYFWLVFAATISVIGGNGAESATNPTSLWLTNPSAQSKLPPNAPAIYQQQQIFQSLKFGVPTPGAICNGGPLDPSMAIRVDDLTTLDTTNFGNSTAFTQSLVRGRRPLIVPANCALIGSNWLIFGAGGGLNSQITLSLLYAQMKLTETIDAW
jgi:hypothetical protein